MFSALFATLYGTFVAIKIYIKVIILFALLGYIGYCELRIVTLKDHVEEIQIGLTSCEADRSICENKRLFTEDNYRRLQQYEQERGDLDQDGVVTQEQIDRLKGIKGIK